MKIPTDTVALVFSSSLIALAGIQRAFLWVNLRRFSSHPYILQRGGLYTMLNGLLAYTMINISYFLATLNVPCIVVNVVVVFGVVLAGMTALERMLLLYIKYHTGVQFRSLVTNRTSEGNTFRVLERGAWLVSKSKTVVWISTFLALLIECIWLVLTQKEAILQPGLSLQCYVALKYTEFLFMSILVYAGGLAFAIGAYFLRTVSENFKILQELKMSACVVIYIAIFMTVWLIVPTSEITVFHFAVVQHGVHAALLAEVLVCISGVWVVLQLKKDISTLPSQTATHSHGEEMKAPTGINYGEKLRAVLDDQKLSHLYEEYLLKEFAVENILAYKAISEMQKKANSSSPKQTLEEGNLFYQLYLSENAKLQVNLPSHLKNKIEESANLLFSRNENNESLVSEASLQSFLQLMEEIKNELFILMKNDSFRRFARAHKDEINAQEKTSRRKSSGFSMV